MTMGTGHRMLPIAAIAVFAISVLAIVSVAGATLGYDYQAYLGAAQRLIAGRPLYDATADVAGPFAIYLYPPPFAIAFVPFTWLSAQAGIWLWIAACTAMVVAAVAILPVRAEVRWVTLLLAGLDWPVLYSIKLGQVGPLLLLLFAIGWRWLDRPTAIGAVAAIGTVVKVQPALLFGWMALTRRWTAITWGLGLLVLIGVASVAIVGIGSWFDLAAILGRVSAPVTTPHNYTIGAVAYQAGVAESTAALIQLAVMLMVVAVVVAVSLRRDAEISYLATVVASQLLSPLLWDHYAIVLLLPTAWLLQRRQTWAVVIPLSTSILLVGFIPPVTYPLAFGLALVAPALVAPSRTAGAPP